MPLLSSWIEAANDPACPFPLNNLPCGVFSVAGGPRHCGVAIGDQVLDVTAMERAGLISLADRAVLDRPEWNAVMALGPAAWTRLRNLLFGFLRAGSDLHSSVSRYLHPLSAVELHLPFSVTEFTDFYASHHHAQNVGTMFRGAENALPPNWRHLPIGYNGRASSVVVSGTDLHRPWGQLKGPNDAAPRFAPCERFDFELEMGAVVGTPSRLGRPVTVAQADAMIFGYVLLNDWSARDIQAWEYQPLGPFQAKATATTISPWIVTRAALDPFRVAAPEREPELLPYLHEPGPMNYDIELEVELTPQGGAPVVITRTNYREMYYSAAQQLAHHTTAGAPMRPGDLLGSGTVSGPERDNRGSLLELAWGGKEPLDLGGGVTRSFLEDNDRLTLRGWARAEDYTIGFGECSGILRPAIAPPWPVD
ncbi:fumarylacetoacetase [Pararhodobacter sp. SW119]|uniref:fumarylacetoacetase n=1 Tax=Pararhodobacter sp. SW119 TaxID=2780075 RepID=UPI001ADF790D|nr:fumarylacetoacetase [Pararhodobacter sp. SW119]